MLAAAFLAVAPAPARAQDEFLLNDDRVDRNQWAPRAAVGTTGAIVVAWMDGRNGATVVDFDIYMLTLRDPQALGSTVNRRLNDDGPGSAQALRDIASQEESAVRCASSISGSPRALAALPLSVLALLAIEGMAGCPSTLGSGRRKE